MTGNSLEIPWLTLGKGVRSMLILNKKIKKTQAVLLILLSLSLFSFSSPSLADEHSNSNDKTYEVYGKTGFYGQYKEFNPPQGSLLSPADRASSGLAEGQKLPNTGDFTYSFLVPALLVSLVGITLAFIRLQDNKKKL